MIKHVWTVICKSVSVAEISHNISLLDVIEQFRIVLPGQSDRTKDFFVPVKFEVVSSWIDTTPSASSTAQVRSFFRDPSGHEIMHTEYSLDLTALSRNRLRHRGRVSQFLFTTPGDYWLNVSLLRQGESEWVCVAEVPLSIIASISDENGSAG